LVFCLGSSLAVTFTFQPKASPGNCLTMSGDTTGNTFTVSTCTGGAYQAFFGTDAGSQLYMLGPFTSPDCGPVAIAVNTTVGTGNGAPVVGAAFDPGNKAQYWTRATPTSLALPGYMWYKNLVTGRCLTMEGGGSYIDQWDCSDGQTHQMWLANVGGVTGGSVPGIVLKNQALLGTQCLNTINSNPNPGSTFDAQLCNPASYAHNFDVSYRQTVAWQNTGSSKCMDGNTGVPAPFQYPCTPTAPNHQWAEFYYLGETPTSGTHFMNIGTGWCLTWNPSNLNDVHTEACVQGNTNQMWTRA